MASRWNKKQLGILCGTGLLTIGYLLNMTGVFSGAAKAQPKPIAITAKPALKASSDHATKAPVDPPLLLTGIGALDGAIRNSTESTRAASAPATDSSIEQLVEQLQGLRARRAELERQEKQVVAALKEKLKEQQERLQKLGINAPINPPLPSVPGTERDFGASKASFETGSLKLAEPRDGGTKK